MAIKDDYVANTLTKGKLIIPTNSSASLIGNIETQGDHDWFKVSLVANKAYHFGVYSITEKTFFSTYDLHNSAGIKLSFSRDEQYNVFIPNKSGDYYINVSGNTGKYEVFATEYYDDYTNNISTTGEVINNIIIGNSDYGGDIDWFKINMVAGRTYYFDNEYHLSDYFDQYNENQSIKLYNSTGKSVPLNTISRFENNSIAIFTPKKTANYFFGVSYDADKNGLNQNYNIEINSFIDDFGNTIAQAHAIITPTLNKPTFVKGNNEAFFDKDFFAITLKSGITYKIYDTLIEKQEYFHDIKLYSTLGKILQTNDNKEHYILFKPTTTSKFYLNVNKGDSSTKNYTLAISELDSAHSNTNNSTFINNELLNPKNSNNLSISTTSNDDYTDNLLTKGSLAISNLGNSYITGNIEKKGDHDWIKVHLLAGNTYQLDVESIKDNIPFGFALRDSTGKETDYNFNYKHEVIIKKTGDYYLDVFIGNKETPRDIGTYKITANKAIPEYDDYEDNPSTTGHLINNLAIGNIDYSGDRDWFKVDLQANQTYFFSGGGGVASNHGEYYWIIAIYDGNRVFLKEDNYIDDYNISFFTPKKSGHYYFSVELIFHGYPDVSMGSTEYKEGFYKLTDDFGNDIESAYNYSLANLENPLFIKGKNEFVFDKDFFSVTLKAGATYKLQDTNRPNSPHQLEIYNSSGIAIDSSTEKKPYIIFTTTQTGKYYLNVKGEKSLNNSYFTDHPDYSITIVELQASKKINATPYHDILKGGNNDDTLNGMAGNDLLAGKLGNDLLNGGKGNDRLYGGNGHDTLNGGKGRDVMSGGTGFDKYIVDDTGDQVIEVSAVGDIDRVTSTANFTLPNYVEELVLRGKTASLGIGNNLDNLITTNSLISVTLIGKAGNDKLTSAGGNDVLEGGIGDDRLASGAGKDILNGREGADTLLGGDGNDVLNGGVGNDTMDGGNDNDTLNGGSGNDKLYGGYGNNHLYGGTGNDKLYSNGNNDFLQGGTGNDTLIGSDYIGKNTFSGGSGNDIYIIQNSHDRIIESASDKGIDTIQSTINYTLSANVENLELLSDNTRGYGNDLDNKLEAQNSTLKDYQQGSWLFGYAGNDYLIGHKGNNLLVGGLGKDTYLTSGDTIRIYQGDSLVNSFDVIKELHENDRLDLDSNKIAANIAGVNGNDIGTLHSHHISQGLISFDDLDIYAAPLKITESQVTDVIKYLQANITQQGDSVAFIAGSDTYVFQNGSTADTLVKLVGVMADGIHNTAVAGSIHLI